MIGRADLSDNKLAFDSKSLDGLKQSAKDNSRIYQGSSQAV
jgi:hypothetical protein